MTTEDNYNQHIVKIGNRYRNCYGSNTFVVCGFCLDSSFRRQQVIFYDEDSRVKWSRDFKEFLKMIDEAKLILDN